MLLAPTWPVVGVVNSDFWRETLGSKTLARKGDFFDTFSSLSWSNCADTTFSRALISGDVHQKPLPHVSGGNLSFLALVCV